MKISIAVLSASVLVACHGCKGDADHGHSHSPEGEHAEHDKGQAREPERPDLSVTQYQNGLELFMEYPALVVGESSSLVAHFTDARDPNRFRVVKTGRVTAILGYADGSEEKFVADKLLRDGIFKPDVKPAKTGKASLTLVLDGEQVAGTVAAGEVIVHADVAAAIAASPPEVDAGERAFPFLKEQQWKTEYATTLVEPRVIQGGVRANGELKPVAGQSAELSTPVMARIAVGEAVPFLGQVVKKGQLLVRVIPTTAASATDLATLDLETSRAAAELGLAERALKRMEEMLSAKAVPENQVDEARVARDVAAARVEAARRQKSSFRSTQSGGAAGEGIAFELRSPINGVVSFADVTPGAVVETGTRLVSVVNTEKLWLEAKVYEPEAPLIERSPGATFTVAGFDKTFIIDEKSGRRVAVGTVIDRATRTVPIIFELSNPDGALKPGMYAKTTIFTGQTIRALAVPESAIIDDNGKPTVFVMEGGETFFKRVVKIGIRSGGFVEVTEGLGEGDRVVSRGAYELKLATASGVIPEHGHQH